MAESGDRVTLTTPEQVEVSYELAGLGSRFLAGLVDTSLLALLIFALALVVGYLRARLAQDPFQGWIAWAIVASATLLIYIGYFVLLEMAWQGQSVGKRMAGLRVISVTGAPLSFEQSAVRNILRIVDLLPVGYAAGLVSIMLTSRMQRLGDIAAGAMVVKERLSELPEPAEAEAGPVPVPDLPPGVTDEVLRSVRVGARAISREELRTIRHFLERRFELAPDARYRVAGKLAGTIRRHFPGLPEGQLSNPELLLEVVIRAVDESG